MAGQLLQQVSTSGGPETATQVSWQEVGAETVCIAGKDDIRAKAVSVSNDNPNRMVACMVSPVEELTGDIFRVIATDSHEDREGVLFYFLESDPSKLVLMPLVFAPEPGESDPYWRPSYEEYGEIDQFSYTQIERDPDKIYMGIVVSDNLRAEVGFLANCKRGTPVILSIDRNTPEKVDVLWTALGGTKWKETTLSIYDDRMNVLLDTVCCTATTPYAMNVASECVTQRQIDPVRIEWGTRALLYPPVGDSVIQDIEEEGLFFETGRFLTGEEVSRRIIVPEDISTCPEVVVFISPARGGTTAMGLWMAGLEAIDRSYFQGFKGVIRGIVPNLMLDGKDDLVFIKDTLGPKDDLELFDPVKMLLDAGVPRDKIKVVVSIRDPIRCFSSLTNFLDMDPKYFGRMQNYAINLYLNYMNMLGSEMVVPFVYDLLDHGVQRVLSLLLNRVGINVEGQLDLEFNEAIIREKMIWGEAHPVMHPVYYEEIIAPILRVGSYSYVSNTYKPVSLGNEVVAQINALCCEEYRMFKTLAEQNLLGKRN